MKRIKFFTMKLTIFVAATGFCGLTAETSWAANESYSCKLERETYSVQGEYQSTITGLPAVHLEDAQRVYQALKAPKLKINYREAHDGCYQRAEKINSYLEKIGLKSVQAFIQTEPSGDCGATGAGCINGGSNDGVFLSVESPYEERSYYSWEFHTAPAICVAYKGRVELYILDPSTFLEAVPLREWTQHLSRGLESHEYSTFIRPFY